MASSRQSFDPKGYWETRLARNPGLLGVGNTSLGNNYNRWLYKLRRRIFLREARSLPLNWIEARVLDVGSGTGFYVRGWQEIGAPSITGSDLTEVAVSRLQQKFTGKEFILLDIGSPLIGRPSPKFDAISAFDVLFHVIDDRRYEAAISNIHAMLVPGGWFIFSDNFLRHPVERAAHQVSRSLADVTSILHKIGFQIVRRRPMFVLMNYPVDTRNRIWKLLWRAFMYPVQRSELLGYVIGGMLYPAEAVLTRLLPEGPSTEIMICRKLSQATNSYTAARFNASTDG